MNVRSKLLVNAFIAIVCVLAVGLTGYYFTNKVALVSMSLVKTQAMPILKINEAEKTAQMIFSRLVVHNSTSESEEMSKIEQEVEKLNGQLAQKIKEYEQISQQRIVTDSEKDKASDTSAAWLQDFQTKWNRFSQIATEILELSQNFNKEDALGMTVVEGKTAYDEALAVLQDKIQNHQEQMTVLSDEAVAARGNSLIIIVAFVLAALGIAVAGGLLISRSITKPLNRAIEGLTEGTEQVSSAAGQVSSGSQQLADGSSEQAASLEETSSSMEEMASMTKQNAGHASQADNLMKDANQIAGRANEAMSDLTTSIEEISRASEDTSKIIKTIDEIAFQTNLLALNAAVEAARAGEAGAGFAVVADEVRNLAMRAADAARNTAQLIEGTVKKVKDGSELVVKTSEAFSEVAQSVVKGGELVAEIAAASSEQAQGIENVNRAVGDMDKVTQQNAANAEESASAAEEMSAQAEQMKGFVNELVSLIGGRNLSILNDSVRKGQAFEMVTRKVRVDPILKAKPQVQVADDADKTSVDQVVPLNDDFKDF